MNYKNINKNKMTQPICGVCLEECGEKNTTTTECGHTTHLKCFIRVLSTSDNCIYCRKKLNLAVYFKEPQINDVDPFVERHSMWVVQGVGDTILTAFITILIYGTLVWSIIHMFNDHY